MSWPGVRLLLFRCLRGGYIWSRYSILVVSGEAVDVGVQEQSCLSAAGSYSDP